MPFHALGDHSRSHLGSDKAASCCSTSDDAQVLLAKRSFKGLRELRNSQCSNAILVKDVTWLRELITRSPISVLHPETYPPLAIASHRSNALFQHSSIVVSHGRRLLAVDCCRRGATVRYTYPDMPGRTHLHVAAATNSDEAVRSARCGCGLLCSRCRTRRWQKRRTQHVCLLQGSG
eukprot:3251080-Rhodomonas_salina.1